MPRSRARVWADILSNNPATQDNSGRGTFGSATTASATLDVATDSGDASVEIQAPASSNSILKFGDTLDDNVGHLTYNHATDTLTFTVNASEAMRIDSGGELSIGTTSSSGALTINADSNTTNNRALHLQITDDVCDQTIFGAYIDYNISGSDATTTNQTHVGLRIDTDSSATGGDTSNEHRIYSIYNTLDITGDSDIAYGMYNGVRSSLSTADTTTSLYGHYNLVQGDNTAGTIANEYGIYNLAYSDGTVTNLKGESSIAVIQAGAAITNSYGVHSEVQIASGSSATTMYGVRSTIDDNGGTSTNQYLYYGDYQGTPGGSGYGLYITGETDNYLSGDLTVAGSITSGYSTGQVIEELHAVCNTTSLHGRATIQNVTSSYTIGQSYGDATGSLVTGYTPPSGTKMIVYEYTAHLRWLDAHAISHWRLYYQVSGGSWVEVTKARTNRNGYYPEDKQVMRWVFEVGAASDDSTLGIFSAATPQLGFKWQTRDYGTSNERGYLHLTQYWDGAGTDVYSQPMIMIKAIA